MAGTQPPRSVTPTVQQDYDVTRMREEDFERLAVYIVPDVPCDKGVPSRADKTLPRSLTLKPSLVLSTPTATVGVAELVRYSTVRLIRLFQLLLYFTDGRSMEYRSDTTWHPVRALRGRTDTQPSQ